MLKVTIARTILGAVLLLGLFAMPASAQTSRTWVSGVGDDANPCTRTAPCKTFAGTITKTAAGGTISVLDPGDFGAMTITKAISIQTDPANGGGIVVDGAKATVLLNQSVITGNVPGLSKLNSGKIQSFGNNVIRKNSPNGKPSKTVKLK